jgi:hypothetical protein
MADEPHSLVETPPPSRASTFLRIRGTTQVLLPQPSVSVAVASFSAPYAYALKLGQQAPPTHTN